MSDWKIIVPGGAVTNLVTNPSFETNTTGWGSDWADTLTRSADYAKFGAYSLKITGNGAAGTGARAAITVTATLVYTFSAWVYVPTAWDGGNPALSVYENAYGTLLGSSAAITERDQWVFRSVTVTPSLGTVNAIVYNSGAATTSIYIDAVVFTRTSEAYTYIDGDQPGCEWNGGAHASTSTLSGANRAGGTVEDLGDDYGLVIESVLGFGMTPRAVSRDGYGQLPGGALNASVRASRTITLIGMINASSVTDFHDKRNALIDLFNPEAYPATADGWQPVILRYTGGTTDKEIAVHYEAGLEGDWQRGMGWHERVAIRLYAPDPNWYAIGEAATHLDTNDTATLRYVAGRLKSTGQWDDLGLTADPTTFGYIYAVCVARDHSVYVGGTFTGMNNVAGRDYIARYIPSTDTWETVVGASDLNGAVWVISEGPDGKIYVGGEFTNADGNADADYIAVHDPVADTWDDVGAPALAAHGALTQIVYAIAWDSAGAMYIGGVFANAGGVAAADCIAKWDGAAWAAVGTPNTGAASITAVRALAIDKNDNIFAGGDFTNFGDDADADYWAWWNGTTWAAVDDIALNNVVYVLEFDAIGNLYVGGTFTDADAVTQADKIFMWTGTAVEPLETGTNNAVYIIRQLPDGLILVAGVFTTAGGLSTPDYSALWNGSAWVALDVNLPATTITGFDVDVADATVPENYNFYIGTLNSGSAYFAGDTTVTNAGSVPVYPQIVIARSGGTTARALSVRNWRTGKELYLDYSLLDGETLTIDTSPDAQAVESSFFGSRPDAVLAGSDFGEFFLLPGSNTVTAFVDVSGAPTITAYVLFKTPFDGMDD